MYVTHLECSKTGKTYEPNKIYNLSEAGKPLLVRYDLKRAAETLTKDSLTGRVSSLWRYREVLPVVSDENIVTLGEGWTPLPHAKRLGALVGMPELFIKDEGANPTGSFKARGQTAAISMAKELGVKKVAIPTAGNAGGAMSAYAAASGLEAYVFMPRDTPAANRI
ncbi:MAG TPA: pyridoxal-phosphate dependent enzyme, partial [Blastocatellia bacterium]|nr:pyridoxal-phosphate dependent enzyme [Blastocatellia bacterium]